MHAHLRAFIAFLLVSWTFGWLCSNFVAGVAIWGLWIEINTYFVQLVVCEWCLCLMLTFLELLLIHPSFGWLCLNLAMGVAHWGFACMCMFWLGQSTVHTYASIAPLDGCDASLVCTYGPLAQTSCTRIFLHAFLYTHPRVWGIMWSLIVPFKCFSALSCLRAHSFKPCALTRSWLLRSAWRPPPHLLAGPQRPEVTLPPPRHQ